MQHLVEPEHLDLSDERVLAWASRIAEARGQAGPGSLAEAKRYLERTGVALFANPAKFDRCLEAVRRQGRGYNEYAVCQASLRRRNACETVDHFPSKRKDASDEMQPESVMARVRRRKRLKKNWPATQHLVHAMQEERLAASFPKGDYQQPFHFGKAAAHRESLENNPAPRRGIRRVAEPRFPRDLGRQYCYLCCSSAGSRKVETYSAPLKKGTADYKRVRRLYKKVIGPFKSRYEALKWQA